MEMNKEIGMVTREGMGPRAQCGYLCRGRESWGCGHSYRESHRPSGGSWSVYVLGMAVNSLLKSEETSCWAMH